MITSDRLGQTWRHIGCEVVATAFTRLEAPQRRWAGYGGLLAHDFHMPTNATKSHMRTHLNTSPNQARGKMEYPLANRHQNATISA